MPSDPKKPETRRPLFFVLLWRMVACTRALPDQVWWRLLRSSVNHAPDMERRRLSSSSVSWRTLHRRRGGGEGEMIKASDGVRSRSARSGL